VAIKQGLWIKRHFGWLGCLLLGHLPSRRRVRVMPDGVTTTMCRRCESRLERRNRRWVLESRARG